MKARYVLPFLLVFSFLAAPLFALAIPKRPEGYVSDYAGMISQSKRIELEEKLHRFEEATSNQIVVVTFPSLEGEALEDFSIRLAEAWKIGQKEKNNGVILLIFKNDRKVRIEVGYGLEGVLPDATCKLIIENEIAPRFRGGKFDEGIEKTVQAIMAATKGEYQSQVIPLHMDWGQVVEVIIFIVLFILFLLLLLFLFLFRVSSRGYAITSSGRKRSYENGSGFGGGYFGGGGGGGFGGGGGGGFGGGGASGSW